MIQVCRDACWPLCRFNGCRSTGCLQNCCYCAGARGFKAPRPQLGVGHRGRRRAFAAPRAKLLDQQATVGRQQPIERQQSGDILRHTTTKLGAGTGPWQRGFGSRASSMFRPLMTQEKSAQRFTTETPQTKISATHHHTSMRFGFEGGKVSGNSTNYDTCTSGNPMAILIKDGQTNSLISSAPGRDKGLRPPLPVIRMQRDSRGDVDG